MPPLHFPPTAQLGAAPKARGQHWYGTGKPGRCTSTLQNDGGKGEMPALRPLMLAPEC